MSQWEECKALKVGDKPETDVLHEKTLQEFVYLCLNIEDVSHVMHHLTNGIQKSCVMPIRKCGEQITGIFALLK